MITAATPALWNLPGACAECDSTTPDNCVGCGSPLCAGQDDRITLPGGELALVPAEGDCEVRHECPTCIGCGSIRNVVDVLEHLPCAACGALEGAEVAA